MAKIGTAYVEITGDLTKLNKAIAQVDEKLKRVSQSKAEGKLTLDKSAFDRAIQEGERKLERLERKHARAVLELDTKGIGVAEREMAVLRHQLDALDKQRTSLKIDVDVDRLGLFSSLLTNVQQRLNGTSGSISRFNRSVTFLRNAMRVLSFSSLVAGAGAAVQALSALAAGVIGLAGSLGTLSGALVAIPAGISALGQVVGTSLLGLSGVGDAVKASMDVSTKATQDAGVAADHNRQATQQLADAQRGAREAQEGLTTARREARIELQQLRLEERGATLGLEEARAELKRLREDQSATPLEVERGRFNLTEARERAQRAAREREDAERKGISGSEKVVQAQRQVAQAARAVADAQREATKAQTEGSAATDKLQEEMAKLSPAGRSFVRFLVSLKPRLDALRAVAQRGLLPGVEKGITAAMKNFGALRRIVDLTSRTMGRAAARFGEFLGRKDVGKDLELISASNARSMDRAARALQNFFSAIRHVLVAARPFLDWLTKVSVRFSRLTDSSARAGRESGRMARFLDRTRETMERLGSILQSLSAGFLAVGSSAKKYLGDFLLNALDNVSQKFENFTESAEGKNKMREYFLAARAPIVGMARLVGDVVAAMLRLSVLPGFTHMTDKLRELVPVLEKVIAQTSTGLGPALVDTIASLARVFGVLAAAAGPLTVFVRTLGTLADGFRWMLDHLPGLKHGLIGVASAFAVYKTLNFASSVTGIKALGQAILRLKGYEQGTTFGDVLVGKMKGLGPRVRAAVAGIGPLLRRVFARFGFGAGEAAAESAAGTIAGETAAGGRLGRLRGMFRRLGGRLGVALGSGILAGITGLAIGAALAEALDKATDGAAHKVAQKFATSITNALITALNAVIKTYNKIPILPNVDPLGKVDLRRRGKTGQVPGGIGGNLKPVDPTARARPRTRGEPARSTPPRARTVEIQTPVLSLKAKDVEKSMDRIQRVLRRELGQAGRLIGRLVGGWDEIFERVRLFRGRDPIGLERALRRTGDDAESLAKRIARRIGEAFESISRFARIEGREAGSQLASGLTAGVKTAMGAAERMRREVVQEFGKMQRQGSNEARELVSNLRATFARLSNVVEGPTTDILRTVASAMRALGASGVARIRATAERIEGRAFGGVVPGYSPVDNHIVAVRGGEAVLRPEDHVPFVSSLMGATKQMGLQPYGSLGEMFKRTGSAYAKGGMVDPGWDPGSEVLNRGISGRVGNWAKRYGANMTAGYDPGGSHVSPGHNVTGTATDMVPRAGWAEGPTKVFERGLRTLVSQGLKVLYGTDRIGMPWPNHGRGNHAHIEWGKSAGGGARASAGEDATAPHIRFRTTGPSGGLRSTVRGALQKVTRGANRRLERSEGSANLSGFTGGGGSSANMKLGRRMSKAAFGTDQWSALRELWTRESGWRTNADNPTSDAYGIPQSLPGSKMRSAGKDWRTNPATQIKWGLRYIKQRYGTPARALAFHDAHNWYARGGIVQALANGGTVDGPPSGAKKPSRRKSGRGKNKPVRLKPFRFGRVRRYAPPALLGTFRDAWSQVEPGGALQEDYEEFAEDADVVQEEFLVDSSGDKQSVDWSAVRIRIGELNGLLQRASGIQSKLVLARNTALAVISDLRRMASEQLKRVAKIYEKLTNNIARLQRLRAHLKNERAKKGKNRDPDTISHIGSLIRAIETQNQELGGTRDQLPRDWLSLGESAPDSALGKIASVVGFVNEELSPDGEGIGGRLIDIQGKTGRGGALDTIGDDIRKWTAEKLDLQPGGKSVTLAPAAGNVADAKTDQLAFMASLGELFKNFGPNFKPLQSFGDGGIIQGPKGRKVVIEGHGGEAVINEDGNLTVTIDPKQLEKLFTQQHRTGDTYIDARHTFANVPKNPHRWSEAVKETLT